MMMNEFVDQVRRFAGKMVEPWRSPDAGVVDAQYRVISKYVPLAYALLMVNTWALAARFANSAPRYLWLYIPLLFTVLCGVRAEKWRRLSRKQISTEEARGLLRRTRRVVIMVAVVFLFWGYSLFKYSNAHTSDLIAFYLAMCILGCSALMMRLCSVSVPLSLAGLVLFALIVGTTDRPESMAMTVMFATVTIGTIMMQILNYHDFENLVAAQARTLALSEENHRLANLDHLTELGNRRYLHKVMGQYELSPGMQTLSVLMLDIDHFKCLNDTAGHQSGDACLARFAGIIRAVLMEERDGAFRYGGEEFVVLLPDCEPDTAMVIAECIRTEIEHAAIPNPGKGAEFTVTTSIGVSTGPKSHVARLITEADAALYQAKNRGRNRVISHDRQTQDPVSAYDDAILSAKTA